MVRMVNRVVILGVVVMLGLTSCQSMKDDEDHVAETLASVEVPEAEETEEGWVFGGYVRKPSAGVTAAGDREVSPLKKASPESGVMKEDFGAVTGSAVPEEMEKIAAEEEFSRPRTESSPTPARAPGTPTGPSGLSAGFSDDNEQFNYYRHFLQEKAAEVESRRLPVSERLVFRVTDGQGKSLMGAQLRFSAQGALLETGVTSAQGLYYFYPEDYDAAQGPYRLRVNSEAGSLDYDFTRLGRREHTVALPGGRRIPEQIPLDIVFVMDTTGSMGEEIERLRAMIEIIHMNLRTLSVKPEIRFGMVLYKDKQDSYRTKGVQLTGDLESFQEALNQVTASGGGDLPEDLEAALFDTLERIEWNPRAVKLAYVVTDAPSHLDYEDLPYGYDEAARRAKQRGIKIHTIGTGGLNLQGEYMLRQIAQHTGGRYIFLTYGETGESEGGRPGSVSHHTGANYKTDRLESIIINFTREELSYLTDEAITLESGYFEAEKVDFEEARKTLLTLGTELVEQLYDFSSLGLEKPVAVVMGGVRSPGEDAPVTIEYLEGVLRQAAVESGTYDVLERDRLADLLEEWELQHSGLFKPEDVERLQNLTAAQVMILGDLFYRKEYWELTLQALRVETGEILAVTRGRIDPELLP